MEDIAVYCSWADARLNEDHSLLRVLPIEIRSHIQQSPTPHYLDLLANTLRDSQYTDVLFPLYKPLFPELLARWTAVASSTDLEAIISTASCLARVLPLATYLRPQVKALLRSNQLQQYLQGLVDPATALGADAVQSLLLAVFRILSFDRDMLAELVGPLFLSSFLRHVSLPIRYLAIQCLCMTMHFADAYSEKLVGTYIGKEAILGTWEGRSIDYRLLKLWEETRWKDLIRAATSAEESWKAARPRFLATRTVSIHDLSPRTANIGGVLLPRSSEHTSHTSDSTFVLTTTAKQNLHRLATCLLERKPILVSGQASSGKTSLVHEAARLLNQQSTMITLHLNEQTDAKSLLGFHTSSADGTSFTWQSGVLTKAMQQGRWVLIEDIDRAPAEVMGVLRPILENDELFLPSRKEKVRPEDGFRILATMKTSGRSPAITSSRHSWLLNPRLWSAVETSSYPPEEVEPLLRSRYPATDIFIAVVLRTHENLLHLYESHRSLKGLQTRKPMLRDQLNLCRRIVRRLGTHGHSTESTVLSEQTKFDIFNDAVDCYAGYLNSEELHELVASSIATSMNISPQQMRYCMNEAFTSISEDSDVIKVGRSTLQRTNIRRRQPRRGPFALTTAARRTLDRIAASAECSEPCLLVGETGVGKTTLVQHVANLVGQTLTVVNLSQQSEAGDFLGGLKPVTARSLILPIVEKFNALFDDTFSAKRNEKFQIALAKAVASQNWPRLIILWDQAVQMATTALKVTDTTSTSNVKHASKKRKLETSKYEVLRQRWAGFSESCKQIRSFIDQGDKTHAFAFVEGRLVQAVRDGEWVLLDEINLAPSDTLDYVVSLLQNGDEGRPSLLLAEAGNIETIIAHPNFRLFAAMNPATDAGKKDLPPGLRSRFTEIYVPAGDNDLEDLTNIIRTYLGSQLDSDKRAALDIAKAYLALKKLNDEHRLTDGAGETPHFSIRSLVRCLLYVSQHSASHGLRRAMYEGFAMSFFTVLSRASEGLALPQLEQHLLSTVKNRKAFSNQQPKMPHSGGDFVAFRHHFVKKGPIVPDFQPHYIRTPSVERNLLHLARAASMRCFPILLQGPTSAGKTSMVEYLAKLSGNRFVRINNHEHTDLQEYLGSYVSDADGKLVYQEGVLVDALRLGHWIVLDELNLAPSDVLEALNRLLDDNRELLIPESQEVVRPHPNFMLFATQNPAGLYGGRKRLSRAFRNRFLEIHFDDIPEDELEVILRERSQIAPSFCTKIVAVYKSLSLLRQSSRLFEQRNSFATLRDLFRWASRPVDDWESLAYHGFFLLAERVRDPAERDMVKKILEKEIKVTLDENVLYGMSTIPDSVTQFGAIVWTPAMRRVFVLVSKALMNREPVLLVGETGCGKTQICQVIAEAFGRPIDVYNAHTNTETGDLIGSQRPVRNRFELAKNVRTSWQTMIRSRDEDDALEDLDPERIVEQFGQLDHTNYDSRKVEQVRTNIGAYQALFAWNDGSLVRAMKKGDHFLLDEISLAEDSVLERLNSVLEPARTILLAEKGSMDNFVIAHPDFQFLATMNPGGDYGKRELSAALRNRLTEIWVPPLSQEADISPIVLHKLVPARRQMAEKMLRFALWFSAEFHNKASKSIALRDLLAWADFINRATSLPENTAFLHGALLVYVDSIGANPAGMTSLGMTDLLSSRNHCVEYLQSLLGVDGGPWDGQRPKLSTTDDRLFVGPFSLPRAISMETKATDLVFDAPTTLQNTMKIVRALQMTRPILLEGSPGVGKTAIVTALAQACGKQFTRINLSDQTDLMDLFGADAPSENEEIGKFSWQDGPLLKAMQCGGWVLLDEMNLASQSVLEGLNACLDHRREVYIAELDKSFSCHPDFTLFAAQNPHQQGGGRKGLPASFVNRFTVVYADSFQQEDLSCICQTQYPNIDGQQLQTLVNAVVRLGDVLSRASSFAQGGPWEFNLRDLSRWIQLCMDQPALPVSYHLRTILTERFRSPAQRELLFKTAGEVLGSTLPESFYNNISETTLQVGTAFLSRDDILQHSGALNLTVGISQLPAANSIMAAIRHSWPLILVGPSGTGKTALLRYLAAATGVELIEFSMNADVDAMDLVGGFEQHDAHRDVAKFQSHVREVLRRHVAASMEVAKDRENQMQLLTVWQYLERDNLKVEEIQAVLPTLSDMLPELRDAVEAFSSTLKSAGNTGLRFVWNDGILVDAVQKGAWLVLDNANLCNPSVLDRLNSLLEPNGVLTISEQHNGGTDTRVIKPHPDFRLFMTMDPRYGELSRAMRNRSLEIFLSEVYETQPDATSIQYPLSAAVSRLRNVCDEGTFSLEPHILQPSVDNLNERDMALIFSAEFGLPGTQNSTALQTEVHTRRSFDLQLVREVSASTKTFAKPEWPQLAVLNEPLMQLQGYISGNERDPMSAELFTRCWYMVRQMAEIHDTLKNASARADNLAFKDRTALERSATAKNQKELDSSLDVAAFARYVISRISEALRSPSRDTEMADILGACGQILAFVQQLLLFCDTKTVDAAYSHSYLQLGARIAHDIGRSSPELASTFSKCLGILSTRQHTLNTGFGLQLMWHTFRPKTAATLPQLRIQLALEGLITRFDKSCRYLPQSRASLAAVRSGLQRTYQAIVESEEPENSLEVLENAVASLESQSKKGFKLEGKFDDTLHFISENIKLQGRRLGWQDLELLQMFTPESDIQPLDIGDERPVPKLLAHLSAIDAGVLVRGGSFGIRLGQQLLSLQEQPLGALSHAKEELHVLAKALTMHTASFEHFLGPLRESLCMVLGGIMYSHREVLTQRAQACIIGQDSTNLAGLGAIPMDDVVERGQNHDRFRDVYLNLIHLVVLHLNKGKFDVKDLKTCLINMSLAGLVMMVPDKLFDPAIYPTVAYQLHEHRVTHLSSRIVGQRHFHKRLMGQDTALVIRILEQELLDLGPGTPPPAIVRPGKEEHFKLHQVFTGITGVVLNPQAAHAAPGIRLGSAGWIEQWCSPRGKSNLKTIIERLEKADRAYDDFAKPILWLLKSLYLGLELSSTEMQRDTENNMIDQLFRATPLVSADPATVQDWTLISNPTLGVKLRWLEHVGLKTTVTQKRSRIPIDNFLEILDSFYHEWKTRLIRDQAEAATSSRYYTYRGDSTQNEGEDKREMDEMFPQFEGEEAEDESQNDKWDARATAIKLSALHGKIYSEQDPSVILRAFILSAIEAFPEITESATAISDISFTGLLPAILLQVESKMAELGGNREAAGLNIYADSDTTQNQKLFDLVHQIQSRFHNIQEKWPEHAVPADVLSFCTEVLHLSFGDPVAKLLTKTEKLYEIVSQWQSVASREWSVGEFVEQLSSLIISWRRLELLSWSRLLDEEKESHEQDAHAWYFIAYEAVIHNSKNINPDDCDLQSYRKTLVQTLEEFFKSTTLGQYSSRLGLLDTLNKTLQSMAAHNQHIRTIATSVQSVINHHRRYEASVEASLQKGRADLEKALSEQIKLASWKDTNITALRESARRSHHRLFKIVRRYRALLNQVVVLTSQKEPIQLPPLIELAAEASWPQFTEEQIAIVVERSQFRLQDWNERPDRLTKPLVAARSIQHLYTSKITDLQAHDEVASFRNQLDDNIKELQTQTPSTLTKENGSFIRHLQERKRRLLADTLKAVAIMGIRRNLPTSELEKQCSTATILSLPNPDSVEKQSLVVSSGDHVFHELLDMMSQVRVARMEHSDDLTDGEVNRCVGLLEGLLSVSIHQRQVIPKQIFDLDALTSQMALLRSVTSSSENELIRFATFAETVDAVQDRLAWLAEILAIGCRIFRFQAEHASLDLNDLIDTMQSYVGQVTELRKNLHDQPLAPPGMTWKSSQILLDMTSELLSHIGSRLRNWQVTEPRTDFLLSKTIVWAEQIAMVPHGSQDSRPHITLQEFDNDLKDVLDQVFVALQKLSTVRPEMPNSEEDPGWLVNSDKHIREAIRSLQVDTISHRLRVCVTSNLQFLSSSDFNAAKDLLIIAMPILEQFHYICEHLHSRQATTYLETARLALQLAKSFTTLASKGFCRPSDPADGNEEQSGQLESGTGLGEGEGAEDISKDVQDDEDLSELAQQGQKEEREDEMENVEDAVDMDHEDLEGEKGDHDVNASDQEDGDSQSEDEDENEIDEEAGSVDDLDPNAVDEKMWDDMKNEAEKNDKELKNDKAKGQKSEDQTAADGEKAEEEDMEGLEGEEQEMSGEDEGAERPEGEQMDAHVDEEKALDLPEELNLAGDEEVKDDDISDDGMDEMSDIFDPAEQVEGGEVDQGDDIDKHDQPSDDTPDKDEVGTEEDEAKDGVAQNDEIMEDQPEEAEEDQQINHETRQDDAVHDTEEKTGGEVGAANEVQDNIDTDQTVEGMNQADEEANTEQSRPGRAPENDKEGETGKGPAERGTGRAETLEFQQNESLRKLADVLEQWHQRREILPVSKQEDQQDKNEGIEMADADLEHVQGEDEGNTQALGAAEADQAQNLDQSKAIEDEDAPMNEDTAPPDVVEPEVHEDITERFSRLKAQSKSAESREAGAFVPDRQPHHTEKSDQQDGADAASDDLSPDIEHLELSSDQDEAVGHLTSSTHAAQLWNQCSTSTHQFSLILTEQLRLILSPTTAAKLRGDYRTGKRLNIKRIIPYIASNYKRDKIWMRRSVPSKRNYQIMIAVDDSKSMSESGADVLAFETLALLTKSLAMLEVGEICVVGFGDAPKITVAHPFGVPFSPAESGPNAFQAFSFGQTGTNVKSLVRQSIELFRDARQQRQTGGEEQWQLELIVSDGHISDHDAISRLVRQAHDEKIIIVFVIVDAGQESILDLKEAVYERDPNASANGGDEMKLRMKRYLDGFPFPFYLVVRDIRDLPGVLATALKGWFGSVVDVQ